MPVPPKEVAALLQDRLRVSGSDVITMDWDQFYKLNDMDKFRPERSEEIRRVCLEDMGIIFACGNRGIVAARDTNFAPVLA